MSSSSGSSATPDPIPGEAPAWQAANATPDLGQRAKRAGAVTVIANAIRFVLSFTGTVILARLLTPEDFGLVGMVAAVTGLLRIFRDGGLSSATVQRAVITTEQVSTLFWLNVALGVALTGIAVLIAPALAAFYGHSELVGITVGFALTFLLGSLTVQHMALLQRQMRFVTIAWIEMVSTVVGIICGIAMAYLGYGYWSLVGLAVATTTASIGCVFVALPWRPGLPRRGSRAGALVRFGGAVTGAEVCRYAYRNADNVMIGWYWGAGQLGWYSRAYGLLMLVINQVNGPITDVVVAALSRVQSDAARLRRYFISGYALVTSINLPLLALLAVYADDFVRLALGPQWLESINIFRALAPAAIVGALLEPLGWLFLATGRADRQLRFSAMWAVAMIGAFALGLQYGPVGVAAGYSAMSCLIAYPLCRYALRGTPVKISDMLRALGAPAAAVVLAAGVGIGAKVLTSDAPLLLRTGIGGALMLLAYALVLLVGFGLWPRYRDLVRQLFLGPRSS